MGGSSSKVVTNVKEDPEQRKLIDKMKEELASLSNQRKDYEQSTMKLLKQLADLKKEFEQLSDPSHFSEKRQSLIDKFINALKMYTFPPCRSIQLNGKFGICIIGPTSSGKSMMLNALAGKKICKVGAGETTLKIEMKLVVQNLAFFDVPGNNDRVDYLDLDNLIFFKAMKLIIISYSTDPASVRDIIRACSALNVDFICVRNQADKADTMEELDRVRQSDMKKIREYISDQPNNQKFFSGLYMLSSRNVVRNEGETYDWFKFQTRILSLSE